MPSSSSGAVGVGSGAVQGAVVSGARVIVAVNPLPFERATARSLGATHDAASIEKVMDLVVNLTHGRMADVVVMTPGVLHGELIGPALRLVSKDGRLVCVAAAPSAQTQVTLDLIELVMYNRAVLGTVVGSVSPRHSVHKLLRLYEEGTLKVDELVTCEHPLDDIQAGYDDMEAGSNIRGVVNFGV